ncbi:MAG: S41 family peptidase [Planctomycetes bacterium]|nr:S41 family peptidase [Planctomycetota bacterium]
MLTGLDPDSQFLSGESLNEFKTEADGQFGGLGIEIGIKDGVLSVLTPMRGSPAFRAGIMRGDRILRIDGKDTKGMTLREVVGKLRGRPVDKITLTVLHEGAQAPEDIVLTREIIRVPTVQGARMVDDQARIAYVHLTNLREKTAEELDQAIKAMEQEGMKALVLDLRFNPGGVVTAPPKDMLDRIRSRGIVVPAIGLSPAIEVADRFISKGVIFSTKGRKPASNDTFEARGKGTYPNFSLVVLVNKGTAAGAEIIAGAIRDHKRGILLGEKTFGKGSIQTLIPLEGGKSAVQLTTGKWFTPSGECIHQAGIKPDLEVTLDVAQLKALGESMSKRHVEENRPAQDPRKAPPGTETKDFGDIQLQKAIELLKGMLELRSRPAT